MIKIILILVLFFLILYCFNTIEKFTNNNYILPKVIYCYWHDSESKLMNAFVNNWKNKLSKEWQIIFINDNNINNYVNNEFIKKYNNLEKFRFSDFLRLELLKNNGGVWMDISTIITNGNFLDKYHKEMIDNNYDVCVYEFEDRTLIQSEPYLENWFIMAPKNSKYIIDLYNQFEKAREMDFLVYKKNILLPSGINLLKTLNYEDSTYLMQHAIVHYLLKTGNQYKINKKNAKESFLKLHISLVWDSDKIINNILTNNDWSNYYAIKLCGNQRKTIKNEEEFIKRINTI